MSETTTNIILNGLTLALHTEYPDSKVFVDEVQQGLSDGDFIVVLTDTDQTDRSVGDRLRRSTLWDVIYFPKNGKTDAYEVGDNLLVLLKVLDLSNGRQIRGFGLSYQFVDQVLHVSVSYPYNLDLIAEQINMEELELNQQGG